MDITILECFWCVAQKTDAVSPSPLDRRPPLQHDRRRSPVVTMFEGTPLCAMHAKMRAQTLMQLQELTQARS